MNDLRESFRLFKYPALLVILGGILSGLVETSNLPGLPSASWIQTVFLGVSMAELLRQMVPYVGGEDASLPRFVSLLVGIYATFVGYLPITTQQEQIAFYPASAAVLGYAVKERGEYTTIEVALVGTMITLATTTALRVLIHLSKVNYLTYRSALWLFLLVAAVAVAGFISLAYGVYTVPMEGFQASTYGFLVVLSAAALISTGEFLAYWGVLQGWVNLFALALVLLYKGLGICLILFGFYDQLSTLASELAGKPT